MRALLAVLLLLIPPRVPAAVDRLPAAHHGTPQEAIVTLARQQLGKRYVFGASSSTGVDFDCSGLAQYAYRGSKIDIPRTAKEQARLGRSVSFDSLAMGDLLIFQKPTGGGLHVGIYSGGGNYINASSVAGRVIERPLRRTELIAARRVLLSSR